MRHVQRGLDGGNQATGIGFARTCQVQGRAVIDRSADKGQAESDVHAFAETGIFEHRQPLVVVHGKDGIGIFEQEGLEHGIGRIRAACVYAFGLQGMKCRNNGVNFFVSQMAAFAAAKGRPMNWAQTEAGISERAGVR